MTLPLLKTKLFAPPLQQKYVARPHLVERLEAGLQDSHRLFLVCAPAGYGKTTLLSEWVHQGNPNTQFGWLSLDVEDNDPMRFFFYFVSALEVIQPGIGQEVLDAPSLHLTSPSVAAALLVSQLTPPENDFVLILDDYHVIEDGFIHEALASLLEYLPPKIHLAISSRVEPPMSLARLRAYAQMTKIDEDDLRFSAAEIGSFFQQTSSLNLSDGEAGYLEEHTDGWAAALQVIRTSLEHGGEAQHIMAAFSGRHRLVFDYLLEDILQPQPDSIRNFLLQTSILERFNSDLCNAVSGRTDSREMLYTLQQHNLFVIPLDEEDNWFRYHHLFSEALVHTLQNTFPDRVADLHKRAALWFEAHGFVGEAMRHTLAAKDYKTAVRIICESSPLFLLRGEVVTLLHWIEDIPPRIREEYADVLVYYAWVLFLTGENSQVLRLLDQVQTSVFMQDGTPQIKGYALALETIILLYKGDYPHLDEYIQTLTPYMDTQDAFLRGIIIWLKGITAFINGDSTASQRAFSESMQVSKFPRNSLIAHMAVLMMGMQHVIQGKLLLARQVFEQGEKILLSAPSTGEASPAVSMIAIGRGEVLREWNELEQAVSCFEDGIHYGQQWGNAEFFIDGFAYMARAKMALGDEKGAHQALDEAETYIHAGKVSTMTARQMAACRARLWAIQGNWDAVETWSETYPPEKADTGSSSMVFLYLHGFEDATRVRLYIARGQLTQAETLITALLPLLEKIGYTGSVIELNILLAIIYDGQGRTEQALSVMWRAVKLAEAEGFVRTFLDIGEEAGNLLKRLRSHIGKDADESGRISSAYLDALLAAFSVNETGERADVANPLSERERDVLRLIGQGASTQEIAEELVIAASTVKTHVNHIHDKLGTRSRTQMLIRARELGLMD